MRETKQAIEDVRAALAIDARDARAQNTLGILLVDSGDLQGALEAFRNGRRDRPEARTRMEQPRQRAAHDGTLRRGRGGDAPGGRGEARLCARVEQPRRGAARRRRRGRRARCLRPFALAQARSGDDAVARPSRAAARQSRRRDRRLHARRARGAGRRERAAAAGRRACRARRRRRRPRRVPRGAGTPAAIAAARVRRGADPSDGVRRCGGAGVGARGVPRRDRAPRGGRAGARARAQRRRRDGRPALDQLPARLPG